MLDTCPGCGLVEPARGWTLDRPMNASPGCWRVCGDVTGFELNHPDLVRRFHQLTVDAYGAQHAGGATPALRVAYSVVGLHLAVDRGFSGTQVRDVHQLMGRPDATWPPFPRPALEVALTVGDVARAGARAESVEGHARLVDEWARAVWAAWSAQLDDVVALTDRVLAR